MEGLIRLLMELVKFLWQFREVEAWERGFYYILGVPRRPLPRWLVGRWIGPEGRVGAGKWLVIPYFMDVKATSTVPALVGTPMLSMTLRDGRTLTFSAAATVQVEDAVRAIVNVDNYQETVQELVSAVLAERLAAVDADRLDPERRGRLLSDLVRWLDQETSTFGVRVRALRFSTFLLNVRTYRLLSDTALPSKSW